MNDWIEHRRNEHRRALKILSHGVRIRSSAFGVHCHFLLITSP